MPGKVDIWRLQGSREAEAGWGERSRPLQKTRRSGARRLGLGAHQDSWKIVFKIICSRRKRQSPRALSGERDEGEGC